MNTPKSNDKKFNEAIRIERETLQSLEPGIPLKLKTDESRRVRKLVMYTAAAAAVLLAVLLIKPISDANGDFRKMQLMASQMDLPQTSVMMNIDFKSDQIDKLNTKIKTMNRDDMVNRLNEKFKKYKQQNKPL